MTTTIETPAEALARIQSTHSKNDAQAILQSHRRQIEPRNSMQDGQASLQKPNSFQCSKTTEYDRQRVLPAALSTQSPQDHNAMPTPRPNYFVYQITKATDLPAIAQAIIDAACHYADIATMKSSAPLCISEARKMINVGRYENAIGRAIDP